MRVQLQAGNGETDGALMIPVLTSFAAGDLLPADDNTIDCGENDIYLDNLKSWNNFFFFFDLI